MTAYGESHPRMVDDRRAMVLVVLDGLGDRPLAELDMQTPAEAASTPHLDALAARGVSGIHLPFGPGRAPSSEVSHWALFGYDGYPFCGRAVLEGRGYGATVATAMVYSYAALRPSEERAGAAWVTGRAASSDEADAAKLFEALGVSAPQGFRLQQLRWGEALLEMPEWASPDVTDTDPFFEHLHPWLQPLPFADSASPTEAGETAAALAAFLLQGRGLLTTHPVNEARRRRGIPALDVLTTKWTGRAEPVPGFTERVGIPAAAVTSTPLYRGLAATLGMHDAFVPSRADHGADLRARFDVAADLIDGGAGFVHVHTKATDEAGHTKDVRAKLEVIEELDAAFDRLQQKPYRDAVVVVTGDHATPSRDGVLHSGDPTPLVAIGPTVAPDDIDGFGESFARTGALGSLRASDVLPLMLGYANRPSFLGTRITRYPSLGLPDEPVPMTLDG
ncbi:MAG: phosphoglycerate mutase, partial [Acidimicrobiia bacterium]|nr:phosphoglycerate mutase [Acidimicrobiia bacterium]